MALCGAIKADGGRCKVEAMPQAEWCWNHHPDYEEARRRRASREVVVAGVAVPPQNSIAWGSALRSWPIKF